MIRNIALLFVSIALYATPSWYLRYSNTPTGFGQSKNFANARANALSDLSQNYKTQIVIESNLQDEFEHETFKSSSNISSSNTMYGIKTVHNVLENGIYFVEVQYEDTSSTVCLSNMIHKQKVVHTSVLSKTPFQQELEAIVGYKVNSSLLKINELYYFKANDTNVLLKKEDLQKLMFNFSEDSNMIMLNQNIYYNGDTLKFRIKSDKKYVNIFQVDCYGRVTLLYLNTKVNGFGTRPSMKRDGAVIDIVSDVETNYEMFVAVFSNHKIINNNFEGISYNVADDSNKQLDSLFRIMQNNEIATVKYKTKKIGAKRVNGSFNGHFINQNF